MALDPGETRERIRAKVAELAERLGGDASEVADDEILPATGLLDSAGILELVAWYEDAFDIRLSQEEINVDNLGSIEAMVGYAMKRTAS